MKRRKLTTKKLGADKTKTQASANAGSKGASRGFLRRKNRKNVLTKSSSSSKMKVQSPALSSKVPSRGIFVLVDGENFVHRVEEILKKQKLIKSRADLKKIDYDVIFGFAKNATKNYYSTILRMPKPDHPLYKTAEKIRSWQSAWTPYLKFKGVNYVKAGYLRVRDGKKCPKCGETTEVLLEKGVDVKIAVDMVANAEKGATLYLVSSDTDLLPAITEAKKRGAKVVYVAFEGNEIKLISKYASETKIIKKSQVKRAFKEVK